MGVTTGGLSSVPAIKPPRNGNVPKGGPNGRPKPGRPKGGLPNPGLPNPGLPNPGLPKPSLPKPVPTNRFSLF
ncbi:MAG TPA: hypothetical protein GXZ57_06775 [Acholeplasmataceae bacterium]|nr:hypothetical protein [Acholeplasmataceae bacterium]